MSTDVLETMHQNLDRLPATTGQAWLESLYVDPGDTEEIFDNLGKVYVAMFGYPTEFCTYGSCGWTTFKYLEERYPAIGQTARENHQKKTEL